ncbi:MAG: anti-sigma factor [Caldimonas sp.]
MKPKIDSQQVNAFVDAELDLGSQLELEERMQADASLRDQVEGLRQLRTAIREGADYHAAPAALRSRLAALAAPKPVVSPRSFGAATLVQRWFGWRPMAASFGAVAAMVLALNLFWLRSSQEDRMLDDVVASHVRSTLGQHLVDVASSDHHTVKPWLSSKLDFSPPVNDLHLPDCVFVGGRVDYLDGRPVAALVYRKGEHIVSNFVWPTVAKDSKADFTMDRGFQTAQWSQGAMTHWVVSDVNREEFRTVVTAIQVAANEK